MVRVLFLFSLVVFVASASAQQHVFTNKEGAQIFAEIVSVDPDWKKMTIRKDGNSFDIEPRVLVLDDQQFVKDWLRERGILAPSGVASSAPPSQPSTPAPADINRSDVQIDVEVKRKQIDSDRQKGYSSYYRHDTKVYAYDIELTSGGRMPIPPVKVSYALVWKESVSFPEGSTSYSTFSSSRDRFAILGEQSLTGLTYNRTETVSTDNIELHSVVYDGNETYREDEFLGVLVNMELADGTSIFEYASSNAQNKGLSWDSVKRLPSKPRYSVSSRDDDDDDGDSYNVQLQKGQSKDGPIALSGKRISISANVSSDVKNPNGVIVAIGGQLQGAVVYVKDRQVYAGIRQNGDFKWVSKPTPLGSFDMEMNLDKSGLSLSLNKGIPAKRSDVKLFITSSRGGIDVGMDSDQLVGEYTDEFKFEGEIDGARILIRE